MTSFHWGAVSFLQRRYRRLLGGLLGLESWHGGSPDRHPYRDAVAHALNLRRPRSVLEFGCGLGDIIAKVDAPKRIGTDLNGRVLLAAALAHPIHFAFGGLSFRRLALGHFLPERFDAVICVNFIHNIAPAQLRGFFSAILVDSLTPKGVLVFDAVSNSAYRFNHDPAYLLRDLDVAVTSMGGFEFDRTIYFAERRA
jgi:SAM-dependent methyltransferase